MLERLVGEEVRDRLSDLQVLEGLTFDEVERVVLAELCRRSLAHFIRQGWAIHHPGHPLQYDWYIDAITEHLEALWRREIMRLIICFPPGFAKSMFCAVFFPAWGWANDGSHQWLCASHSLPLTLRDALRFRQLVESAWYQNLFTPDWGFDENQNAKGHMLNTARGARYSVSVGSGNTGWRGNTRMIDDAMDANKRFSRLERQKVVDWYTGAWSSRKVLGGAPLAELVVGQRLHADDLQGYLIGKGRHEVLSLPNRFESALRVTTSIGWTDPRQNEGELLCDALLNEEATEEVEGDPEVNAAQYQQNPVPEKGLIFERDWMRFHAEVLTGEREESPKWKKSPSKVDRHVSSTDMSFGSKAASASECVSLAADIVGPDIFIKGGTSGKWAFVEACAELQLFFEKHPGSHHWVESKANGPAIIDALGRLIRGIIGVNPDRWGDKEARARAASGTVQAGHVYWPDPEKHPWVVQAIAQICAFPAGSGDDWVDALVQLILMTAQSGSYTLYV